VILPPLVFPAQGMTEVSSNKCRREQKAARQRVATFSFSLGRFDFSYLLPT
jgi:hypothetical protein